MIGAALVRVAAIASVILASAVPPTLAASPAPTPPDVIDQVSVVILQLRDPAGGTLAPGQLDAARTVIEARLTALPAPDASVIVIPGDRIRIDLADPGQLDAVTRVAITPGVFRIVGIPSAPAAEVEVGLALPQDLEVAEIVGPGHVVEVSVVQDELGLPAVDLQLDAQAADALDAWAADHFGEMVALVLDDIVVSAATLQATDFDGRVLINGSVEPAHVQELAAILNGGVLPVPAEPLPDCLPAACPIPSATPGVAAPA